MLLIERGKERSWEKTPNAMTIEGAGRVIQDEDISQPIATFQGVRTHTANVFGGGTSINMAIAIEEDREYFDYLNNELGYKWKFDRVVEVSDSRKYPTKSSDCNTSISNTSTPQ